MKQESIAFITSDEESCRGVSAMQVINAAAVVFVWFVMVETKQRSLAQIQAQLVGSS